MSVRRWSVARCLPLLSRRFLSAPALAFRTEVDDPRTHSERHVGRFYSIPSEVYDGLFKFAGFTADQRAMMSLLDDQSIMVRRPALEIIGFLDKTDFSKPVNRFVICG